MRYHLSPADDPRLRIPWAWIARLTACGLTSQAVDAASDDDLMRALGIPLGTVWEVRAAVATVRQALAQAEAERARLAEQAAEQRRLDEERRTQREAEAAEQARLKAEAEAAAQADAVARLRSNPLRFRHPWPPGPAEFDGRGLSNRVYNALRRAGVTTVAAVAEQRYFRGIDRVGYAEIRRALGINDGLYSERYAPDPPGLRPRTELDDLAVSPLARNVLRRNELVTIDAIMATPDPILLRLPNFGRKSLVEVRKAVGAAVAERRRRALVLRRHLARMAHSWPERARP